MEFEWETNPITEYTIPPIYQYAIKKYSLELEKVWKNKIKFVGAFPIKERSLILLQLNYQYCEKENLLRDSTNLEKAIAGY